MKGFYFKVPKAWEERESSPEKKYYDTEDGMLTVQYAETSEEKINGEKAYVQKLKTRVKDSDYDTDMHTFDCGDGVMTFMMSTLNTSEKDYSDDKYCG